MSKLLVQDNENIIIYADDLIKEIDSAFFEMKTWLANDQTRLIDSGRGESIFFKLNGKSLVLKHYFRGGIISNVVDDQYLWTGLNGARSIREFHLLNKLIKLGLPVPTPFAAKITKKGITYSADLITIEIEKSSTLSELIRFQEVNREIWTSIGECINIFHEKEIYHPDLNTNNILIDHDLNVFLIDFDSSSRIGNNFLGPKRSLNRFYRSLKKTYTKHGKEFSDNDWTTLINQLS